MCDSPHIRQEKIRLSNGFQKSFIFHCLFSKKCHYDSEGVQDYLPRKGGNGAYGKSQELIGILQVQFRKTGHSLYSGIPCFHQMMLNCLLYVNYS